MADFLFLRRLTTRPEIVGFILFFCAGFADGAMVPFFPLWARSSAGIGVGFIGLLFGCYAGGELIATPIIGGIADRIGRRPVLIGSSLGVGLGFVALFFTHGVWAAALVLVAIGVCESVLHPTVITVIVESSPSEAHRRQISLARMAGGLGKVFGPAAGALLAPISLGSVFLASGAALLVAGVVTAAFLSETLSSKGASEDEQEEEEGFSAIQAIFRNGRLGTLVAWFVLLEIAGSWIEAALPLYAHDAGSLSPSGVGWLFTYGAALIVVAQLPLNALIEKRSTMLVMLGAGAALVAVFGILIASPVLGALVAAVTLYAIEEMITGPLVPAVARTLAPASQVATYMSAVSIVSDLRDTAGPASGTALYALSARLPWIVGMPLAALGAVGLGRALSRQTGAEA